MKRPFLTLLILALVALTGACATAPSPGPRPARTGYVDVICLEGCSSDRGVPDTLFGCLLNAKEKRMGTVVLPDDVYLGHVAEFIVRSLNYYEIESHFEWFYGYRVVLKIREVHSAEVRSRKFKDYVYFALESIGGVAVNTAAGVLAPAMPVGFFFEAIKSKNERYDLEQRAQRESLPEPTRSSIGVAWRRYTESLASMWHGVKSLFVENPKRIEDRIEHKYVVEECYLSTPSYEEIIQLVEKQVDS